MKTRLRFVSILLAALTVSISIPSYLEIQSLGYDATKYDFNDDNIISVADAVFLLRYITEDDSILLTDQCIKFGDINEDGLITILDIQTLLRDILSEAAETEPEIQYSETTTSTFSHTVLTETSTTVTSVIQTDYLANLKTLPVYSQMPYVTVNQNIPFYQVDSTNTTAFEYYSPLDSLGRCGVCDACIGQELMPTEERGSIGMIKPSGWHTVRYDGIVDGNYLYNRCHLIGYQLTGENANINNLITGTRYLNVTGMLPFENQTADYIQSTGNHVRYRVTPYFENENLLATGVLMEACSVEDNGKGLQFNVFCYNVQPLIYLDYTNGVSHLISDEENNDNTPIPECDYILNTNTKKFHTPDCPSVADIKESNKQSYTGDRENLIAQGYVPCKRCNP